MGVGDLKNPAAALESAAEMVHGDGEPAGLTEVGIIKGVPSLLFQPSADPARESLGGVQIVDDGVEINVIGTGQISLEDPLEAAESLHPPTET